MRHFRQGRSPAEKAFDRAFVFTAVYWIGFILFAPTAPSLAPLEASNYLLYAIFLMAGCVLWCIALVSFIRSWSDPSGRILSISTALLLILFGVTLYSGFLVLRDF